MASSRCKNIALVLASPLLFAAAVFWSILGLVLRIPVRYAAVTSALAACVILGLTFATTKSTDTEIALMAVQFVVNITWMVLAPRGIELRRLRRCMRCAVFLVVEIALGVVLLQSPRSMVVVDGVYMIASTLYVGLLTLELWTMTSWYQLAEVERRLLNKYCQKRVLQRTVATLGTWVVLDKGDTAAEAEILLRDDKFSDTRQSIEEKSIQRAKSKPYLVLVHGFAAGNPYFMLNVDALSEHFHVFAVEMVGYGRSIRVPWTAQTPRDAAEQLGCALEEWRQEVGIEKMIILGHSLGCVAVSAFAAQHPERVEHLILTSPANVGNTPFMSTTPFKSRIWDTGVTPMDALRWTGPAGLYLSRHYGAARALRSPQGSSFRTIDMDLFSDYAFHSYVPAASGERALGMLLNADGSGKYPLLGILKGGERGLCCPVSIIYGDQQYDWVKRYDGDFLHAHLNEAGVSCTICELPDAGHMLMLDNTDGFNAIIVETCSSSLQV